MLSKFKYVILLIIISIIIPSFVNGADNESLVADIENNIQALQKIKESVGWINTSNGAAAYNEASPHWYNAVAARDVLQMDLMLLARAKYDQAKWDALYNASKNEVFSVNRAFQDKWPVTGSSQYKAELINFPAISYGSPTPAPTPTQTNTLTPPTPTNGSTTTPTATPTNSGTNNGGTNNNGTNNGGTNSSGTTNTSGKSKLNCDACDKGKDLWTMFTNPGAYLQSVLNPMCGVACAISDGIIGFINWINEKLMANLTL